MLHPCVMALMVVAAQPPGAARVAAAGAELRGFEQICLDDFDDRQGYPGLEQLKQRLAQVPGQKYSFSKESFCDLDIQKASGLFRLQGDAWQEGSMLRFSMVSVYQPVRWYFWHGREGVMFAYFPGWSHGCALYGIARDSDKPLPNRFGLWALDEGRFLRTGRGTLGVLYREGKLVVARGDAWLFDAPMPGPPTEVYLECDNRIRGIEMVRCAGGPAVPSRRPAVATIDRPADAAWEERLSEKATFQKLPDGGVTLAVEERNSAGQADLAIDAPDLCEYVFEIEDATPGAGLLLAGPDGNHLLRIAFMEDSHTKRLHFAVKDGGWTGTSEWRDVNSGTSYAGRRQWLSLVVGAGRWRLGLSGDGDRFTYHPDAQGPLPAVFRRVGLYCIAHERKRSITLRRVEVRRFEALGPLATAAIGDRLDDLIESDVPVERKLAALAEATLLLPIGDESIAQRYVQLGRRLARDGHPTPLTTIFDGMLRPPLVGPAMARVDWEDLLLAEVVPLMYRYRWTEVDRLCRRFRFWSEPRRAARELSDWEMPLDAAVEWAWANVPRRLSQWTPPTASPRAYQPLAAPPLSREAFNALAEIDAALRGGAFDDACRVIVGNTRVPPTGMAPDSSDPRLSFCFAAAVPSLVERAPKLREAMETHFGRLGQLRLQAAVQSGDQDAARAVAVQFSGTAAAAEAQRWLGDLSLSAGRFAEAVGWYRRAVAGAAPETAEQIAARVRLAGALVGYRTGAATVAPVRLGGMEMAPADFERLVTDVARGRAGSTALRWRRAGTAAAPSPASYRAEKRGAIDGSNVGVPDGRPSERFDWGARQTAVFFLPDAMIVANRARIAAYGLDDGARRWQQTLQEDAGHQSWPLAPMNLAADEQRLFVRRITRDGAELVCLQSADGKPLWTARLEGLAASDALLGDRDVHVLTLRRTFPRRLALELARLDPDTGRRLKVSPILELHEAIGDRMACQARLVRDRIVGSIGGCSFCCDLDGNLLWVRHHVWFAPRDQDAYYAQCYRQVHDVPLVAQEHVFAFQPGMRSVECLDLESGRLRWHRSLPGVERLVGLVGDRLIAATDDDLLALNVQTGKSLWRHDAPDRLEAYGCGGEGHLLYARLEAADDPGAPRRPELVWLAPADGAPKATCVLDVPPQPRGMLGPLVVEGRRRWVFHARPDAPAHRELWELLAP